MLKRTAPNHHSHRRGLSTAARALLLLLWPWAAFGDPTFYVDFNTPNPNGSGASGAPFKTLEGAVSGTQGNVELEFKRGASAEAFRFPLGRHFLLKKEAGVVGNVRIGNAGYALAVSVNGGGTVAPVSGNYAPGPLQLQASASPQWTFLRWEQGVTGSISPVTVTLGANLTALARFSPTGSADLMVFSASANKSRAQRGDSVTVIWTVENYGGATATSSWKDGVYLSTNQVWDEQDKLLMEKTRGTALTAHSTYQDSLPMTVSDVAPGKYWLIVRTDIETAVTEGVDTVADNTLVAGELLVLDPEMSNE